MNDLAARITGAVPDVQVRTMSQYNLQAANIMGKLDLFLLMTVDLEVDADHSHPSADCEKQGVQEDRDIHKKGAIPNVVEVILNVLVDGECSVDAQLPQAGNSRNHLEPSSMLVTIVFHDKRHLWSWSHQRHVSQ